MEGSILRLIVEKGPREGETLDCRSRSVIRIGRVVKGNTFCIKDAGISSKHLVIELKDGKWVVSDLNTSNGTCLNGVTLQPMSGYDLSDEDVIKIGELTSLKVKIEEESKPPPNGSRNLRKNLAVNVEVAPEIVAEDGESYLRKNPRRGTAASRRTRAAKEEASSYSALAPVSKVGRTESVASVAEENPRRRGRPVRSRAATKDECVEIVENVDQVAEKKMSRRGRKKAVVTNDELVSVLELQKITEGSNMNGQSCREEGLKNKDASVSLSGATNVPEGLNSEEERHRETQDMDQVQKRVGDLDITAKNSTLQEETIDGSVKNSAVKETSPVTNVEKDTNRRVDLEKMTLGEWFDYMEVYLPKQIHEATEEIISSIRERSEQFNEFIQQQDMKGKFQMN